MKNKLRPAALFPLIFLFIMNVHGVSRFENISETHLPVNDLKNNSMDVVSADLDNDGDQDLVIASEFRQNLLLFNDGTGKFSNATQGRLPNKQHDSEDIAVADFDKDEDLDIIIVSEDDQVHEYYLNDGKGSFMDVSERLPMRTTANAVIEGDFDKDGDIDIILGNAGQDLFLENDGKGYFTDRTTNHLPIDQSVTQDIEAADVDGDKDLDLVIGNEDGNRIYINYGRGVFSDETKPRLPLSPGVEETRKVDLADVDRDGDLDIFFSNVNFRKKMNPANRILINNGKGVFTDETGKRYIGKNDLHSADAQFVDLNDDKAPDLLVANIFGGYQQVFINNGKGVFSDKTSQYFSGNPSTEVISVEAGDWNKDGATDIYLGVFRGADVLLKGIKN